MFSGLLLATFSAAVSQAALFQRKSRSGWLEELDEIREDALAAPGDALADMVDDDGIWTDLRDGGEYEDPHEISSLYATDATPDLPVGNAAKPTKPKASRAKRTGRTKAEAAAPPPPELDHVIPQALPPAEVPPADLAPAAEHDDIWTTADQGTGAVADPEQIWVQPAPHPIRPSEMWHPAELAPAPLGMETTTPVGEERVASAELIAQPLQPVPVDEQVIDERVAAQLESELVAAADVAVVEPTAMVSPVSPVAEIPAAAPAPQPAPAPAPGAPIGLTGAPVGRRNRRDRPAAQLPTAPSVDRGEQSPLPVQPLPPAALPTRANRLPDLELPETPSSVVAPRSVGPFEVESDDAIDPHAGRGIDPVGDALVAGVVEAVAPTVELELEPEPPALVVELVAEPVVEVPVVEVVVPAEPEPVVQPAPVAEVPAPVVEAPAPAVEPVAAPVAPSGEVLPVGADGLVAVGGTILRLGGARRADAVLVAGTPVVTLQEGWCWVSPGDGQPAPLLVDLPSGRLTVHAGATVLAVVEPDRSAFVIVADGNADLRRAGEDTAVARGTIAMIDPTGGAQFDQASGAEIELDPIVAENLQLDAEL